MKGYYVLNLLALLATIGIACAQSQPTDTPETTPTLGASQTSKATPRPLAAAVNPDTVVPTKVPLGLTSAPTPAPALTAIVGSALDTIVVQEDYLGYDIIAHRGGYYGIPRNAAGPEHSRVNGSGTLLVGKSVADLKQQMDLILVPAMAEEGYLGFNIIQLADRYYGIPQEEGSFDYDKYLAGGYGRNATGDYLEDVKEGIDGLPPVDSTQVPVLAVEGYMGFNILQLQDQYYGISQEAGSFEYDEFIAGGYERGVTGGSLGEVKAEIDGLPAAERTPVPILILEGYRGYNILQLGLRYFGTLQGEGAFDHAKYQAGGYPGAVDGDTLMEVKDQIRDLVLTGT